MYGASSSLCVTILAATLLLATELYGVHCIDCTGCTVCYIQGTVLPPLDLLQCSYSQHVHVGVSGEPHTSYIIPPDTSVQTVVMADSIQRSCSLAVSTDNDTVIRGVMLFAEQVRFLLGLPQSPACILPPCASALQPF